VADDDACGISVLSRGRKFRGGRAASDLEGPVDARAGHHELAVEVAEAGGLGAGEEQGRGARLRHSGLAFHVDAEEGAGRRGCEGEDVFEDADAPGAADADHHDRRFRRVGVIAGTHAVTIPVV
jgi:hypothetical protein